MSDTAATLRVYGFGPDADFSGGIVGAIERLDRGRILDGLFVSRDVQTGEIAAIDLGSGLSDGTIAHLLDFRLDPAMRRAATRRTLAAGVPGEPAVAELVSAELAAGCATLAVISVGGAAPELADGVSRSGGRMIDERRAAGARLVMHAAELCSIVRESEYGRADSGGST